jgi:hypothetical protein
MSLNLCIYSMLISFLCEDICDRVIILSRFWIWGGVKVFIHIDFVFFWTGESCTLDLSVLGRDLWLNDLMGVSYFD